MKLNDLKYLVPSSYYYMVIFLILNSFFVIILEMISIGSVPLLIMLVSDYNLVMNYFNNYEILNFLNDYEKKDFIILCCILFLFAFITKNIFLTYLNYIQNKFTKELKIATSEIILKNFLNKSFLFYLNINPSVLIRTVTTDVAHSYNYISSLIKLVREIFLVLIIFITLIFINPTIYLSTFLAYVILTSIFYFSFKIILKKRGETQQLIHSENIKNLTQLFNSIKEVKIFQKEIYFYKKFIKNIRILETVNFVNNFISSLPKIIFEIISIGVIVILMVLFILTNQSDAFIISTLSILGVTVIRFVPAFNVITVSLSSLRWFQPSVNVIVDYLKSSQENFYQKETKKKDYLRASIELKNVDFSYGKKNILESINLIINKGDKIGIVGSSGSGKTTLMNLIIGLIAPKSGEIIIDNKYLTTSKESNLLNYVGYVPQDPYILDDTIENNILFGNDLNEKNFDEAISKSQIKSLIENLPQKKQTMLGNVGSKISGGQRQRISISRALYNDPEVLILDEATSALDTNTEQNLIKDVFKNNLNKTIIIVSHRETSLNYCNKIYKIENCRLKLIDKTDN